MIYHYEHQRRLNSFLQEDYFVGVLASPVTLTLYQSAYNKAQNSGFLLTLMKGDNLINDIDNIKHELFGQALASYNARQTRKDRMISDYYEHIRKGKQEKLFNEIVVQFGDMKDCGVGSDNWETAKQMLDKYMRGFEKRNPNLKVFNAVMHLDEATPHLHIDFVPIAHSENRGYPQECR